MASKKGDFESAGSSLVVSEMIQLSDLQSYKDPIREFTEFIKEAMNNHTAAIINQIAILERKTTEMMEETKVNTEHIVNAGDILIKAEKVEPDGSQELSSLFSALFEKIDRVFQNNDLVRKKVENDQPSEVLEDEGVLPEAFIQLTEKKQFNSLLQTDDYLWFYRRRNELNYTSTKRRYGGSKLEEIFFKRGQSLQIHQPQIKLKNLLKIEVGGMQKDWKKYKKKL